MMKLFLRIAMAILLLLVLAACGGGEETADSASGDSTAGETADDGDSEAMAVEETVAEEHEAGEEEMDHAEEDGEESADHEDETDGDEAHEADGDVDSDAGEGHDEDADEGHDADADEGHDDEATDGTMEEDSAEGEAMAVVPAGDGWGESGDTAQSACDHPYMPLREGATWTFEGPDGGLTWEVVAIEGDEQEATAVVEVTVEDLILEYQWNCAEGTGISSFDLAGQGMSTAFPEMTMELVSGEGAFLPPVGEMNPGKTWVTNYEQIMTFVLPEGDEPIEVTNDLTTEQTSTILSAGPITAAGTTVDGVKVEQISNIAMVMNMMGTAVEQSQVLTNVFDLGWGVGIMHQDVQSEFGPTAMELVSFYVP